MEMYNLSGDANKPCSVISFNKCTLMLDCALDLSTALNFLPLPLVPSLKLNNLNVFNTRDADPQLEGELREINSHVFVDSLPEFRPPLTSLVDFLDVDAILISNYLGMLALPYIIDGCKFKGVILMTEPTMQIGRMMMEELVDYIGRTTKPKQATRWKNVANSLPMPLSEAKWPKIWKTAYKRKSITNALSYVQVVAYNQKINICGALNVTAISSGFCLGSCNWVINSDHEKIVYMSASSSLTTHPRPIDPQLMRGADALIITSLSTAPTANPDTMLGEFCTAISQTVRSGGCALVPCYPSGLVYDLFECLASALDNINMSNIPMFFISPVADSSLAYSNIFSEWLSSDKQNKVYQMEDPFPHSQLTKTGRLKSFKNIYCEQFNTHFRQPCIVFCGHPSLRFGDAVHFLEMWGNNPLNAVLFTEPDFDFLCALAPFQPLQIRPIHCPIATSLNFGQAGKLLADLKPKQLLVPSSYTKPPPSTPQRVDLCLDSDCKPIGFGEYKTMYVNIQSPRDTAQMKSDMASALNPATIRPGVHATTITAALQVKDNKYELKHPDGEREENEAKKLPQFYAYGSVNSEQFVQRLAASGLPDAKVEEDEHGCLITVEQEEIMVQLRENGTHIITNNTETREKLTKILLECLNHF